jgi:hypothetical protein
LEDHVQLKRPFVTTVASVGLAVALTSGLARSAGAQMLGAPVLQNAFTNRGFTIGVDFGAGDDLMSYGAAAAWSPMSAKYQFSAGVAYLDPKDGSGTATYGARLMVPVIKGNSPYGVAPFVGMGGANFDGVNDWQIPLGISAGYRRALGASGRGISAYVSPFYTWARIRRNEQTETHGLMRVSIGVDAVVLPRLGVTVGYETGQKAKDEDPGARGGIFGAGVSYALHKPGSGRVRTPGAGPAAARDSTP